MLLAQLIGELDERITQLQVLVGASRACVMTIVWSVEEYIISVSQSQNRDVNRHGAFPSRRRALR